jgi:hypothetical protein
LKALQHVKNHQPVMDDAQTDAAFELNECLEEEGVCVKQYKY